MAKKHISYFIIRETHSLSDKYQYLSLELKDCDADSFKSIKPGQFAQIKVNNSQNTFLRRPISINDVDVDNRRLSLLIRKAGDGTRAICSLAKGEVINMIWPLGNGFSTDIDTDTKVLIVGGGVGVAPLLHLGKELRNRGLDIEYLLGAQSKDDLLLIEDFKAVGRVHITTDDGSAGEKGLVTQHSVLTKRFDKVFCCGPLPMMKGIARLCRENSIDCEVSLENVMACGVGACLCCVEPTVKGNKCVCTEGPVFNIDELLW